MNQAYKVMATVKIAGHQVVMDVVAWQHLSGHRAKRLIAQFDLNGSQKFEKAEGALAGNRLAPETIGGLFVAVNGQGLVPQSAQSKAVRIDRDSIEVMALLRYVLPTTNTGEVTIGLRKGKGDSRGLEVSCLPPVLLLYQGAQTMRLKPIKLRSGDRVSFGIDMDAFGWFSRRGLLPF